MSGYLWRQAGPDGLTFRLSSGESDQSCRRRPKTTSSTHISQPVWVAGCAAACDGWVTRRERLRGWELAKVYVSSTVADLKRERRAVMEWLVAAGHQPVHSYLPNSDTVRDSCLEDVDGCDLYVLIAGHRYGFQPSGDNTEGLSVTHLEFRRAGQSGKPRIALLRTSIPDVAVSDLADLPRLALVSAFREEVAREVRPAEFSDLRGLIQGLSTGVQAELARRSPAAGRSRALFPPPVLDVEPRGRGQVIDELAGLALAPPGQAVVVAGLGGSGKSTVARAVAARARAQDRRAWWVPAADAVSVTQFLLGLAGELGASRRPGGGRAGRAAEPVGCAVAAAGEHRRGGCWCWTTRIIPRP